MLRFGVATDPGQVRPLNEDSYLAKKNLFAVADGLGGHLAGEVASQMAIETLEKLVGESHSGGLGTIVRAFNQANEEIYRLAAANPAYKGMGTTLTAALVEEGRVVLGHVGDSRAYLLRGGRLEQLTDDHSMLQELLRNGTISEAETVGHPQRHVLTRALGTEPKVDVDLRELPLFPEDILLLCTDGLYTSLNEGEILQILTEATTPQEAAERLVAAANRAGGKDNITVIVVEIPRPGLSLLEELELASELNEFAMAPMHAMESIY